MKTPLVLLLVIVILASIATWDEYQTKIEENEEKPKLTNLVTEEITGINLKNGAEEIDLEKREGDWYMSQPLQTKADQKQVEQLLKTITDFEKKRMVSSDKSRLEDYGLKDDASKLRLTLIFDNGSETHLIGNNAPVGYEAYIRRADEDHVWVGSQYLTTALNKSTFDLRDKKLVPIHPDAITSIRYLSSDGPILVSRSGDSWRMTEPKDVELGETDFLSFYQSLVNLTAESFIDKPSPRLAKAFSSNNSGTKTLATIFLNESIQLSAYRNENNVIVKRSDGPTLYRIKDTDNHIFEKSLHFFRFKRLFSFDSIDVQAFKVGSNLYQKTDDIWNGPDTLTSVLLDMENLTAESFSVPASAKSMGGHLEVVLTLRDGAEITAKLWKMAEDAYIDTGMTKARIKMSVYDDIAALSSLPGEKPSAKASTIPGLKKGG